MKPIKLRLTNKDISDMYCYLGMIIFTTHIGEVFSLPLSKIYSSLSGKYSDFSRFLKIALINNQWISNEQFATLVMNETKKAFENEWNSAAKNTFEYVLDLANCTKLGKTSGYPIYDIKAYAYHLFIAHGSGLDVFRINSDKDRELKVTNSQKKFDQRSLSLSAKIGQILVSTGKEGLFSGSIWDDNFQIAEIAIEKESYKTLWSNWNFNNYTGATTFKHFVNITEDESERKFYYSNEDEERSKKRVTQIGDKVVSSEDLIFDHENRYIINSNEQFFMFKNTGEIVTQKLICDEKTMHFSSYQKTIYKKFTRRIIEVKAAKNCLVIETFDSLFLLSRSKLVKLSSCAPLNFRAYLGSVRLRNIVSATFPDYAEIYLHA